MKNLIILFAVTFSQFFTVFGQKNELNQLFDKYEDSEGIMSIKISKPMFGMLSKLNIGDAQIAQIQPILGKINSMKMLIVSKPKTREEAQRMEHVLTLGKEINSTLESLNYREIMAINNNGSKLKFLSSEPKNGVMEDVLLRMDSGDDKIVMMMDGKLTMNDFNDIIKATGNTTAFDKTNSTNFTNNFSSTTDSNYLNGEMRNVGNFKGIQASTGVKVVFTQAANSNVKVIADADKLQYVITKVEDGILKIYVENKDKRKSLSFKNLSINVSNPKLNSLKTTSGALFKTTNRISEKNINIDASSGSQIKGDFNIAQKTFIDVSSGSNVNVKLISTDVDSSVSSGSYLSLDGFTKNLSIDISSGASAKAQNLKAQNVNVESTSGSNVSVFSTDNLKVRASSGGSVKYKGTPNIISDISKVSGGSLRAID